MRLKLNCSFANHFACSRIPYEDFSFLNRSVRGEYLHIGTDVLWTSRVNNPSIFVPNWSVCNRLNVALFFISFNQFSDISIWLFLLSKLTLRSIMSLFVTIVACQTPIFWVARETLIITLLPWIMKLIGIIMMRLTCQLGVNFVLIKQILLDLVDLDCWLASINDSFPKALIWRR